MPSDREQSIRDQLEKIGHPLPDIIANKPELENDEVFLWKSFWELDTERPSAREFLKQIPITKYYEYAKWVLVPNNYLSRFIYCVRQMDVHYVNVNNDRLMQALADAKAKKRSR